MTKFVWIGLTASLLFACDAGSTGSSGDEGGDDDEEEFNLVCSAELALSGTFVPAGELDPEVGCQPAGTWTFSATVSDMGSCSSVNAESEYSYTVTVDPETNEQTIVYNGPNPDAVDAKITANGSACAGTMRHFSADGTELLNLRPYIEGGTEISGKGEYEVYPEAQI